MRVNYADRLDLFLSRGTIYDVDRAFLIGLSRKLRDGTINTESDDPLVLINVRADYAKFLDSIREGHPHPYTTDELYDLNAIGALESLMKSFGTNRNMDP